MSRSNFLIRGALVLAACLSLAAVVKAGPQPSPTVLPTPTLAAQTVPQVGPPAPTPTLSPGIDRVALRKDFVQAQKAAIAALKHRNSMELKILDSAQSADFKEWWAKEVQKRRNYFADHPEGKDKRAYVIDMNTRRKAFLQNQREERIRRVQEQKAHLDAEQEAQAQNLKDFDGQVKVGQVPPAHLWPVSH